MARLDFSDLIPPKPPTTPKPAAKPALDFSDLVPHGNRSPRDVVTADIPGARITSEKRTPQHNADVGGVWNSYHTSGQAVDFQPPRGMSDAQALARIRARDPKPRELLDERDHVHYTPSVAAETSFDDLIPKPKPAPKSDPAKPVTAAGVRSGIADMLHGPYAPIDTHVAGGTPPPPPVRAPITPLNPPKPKGPTGPLPPSARFGEGRLPDFMRRPGPPEPARSITPAGRRLAEAGADLSAYTHPQDPTNPIPAIVGAPGAVWHGLTSFPAGVLEGLTNKDTADVVENAVGLGVGLRGPKAPRLGEIPEYAPEAVRRGGRRGGELNLEAAPKPAAAPPRPPTFADLIPAGKQAKGPLAASERGPRMGPELVAPEAPREGGPQGSHGAAEPVVGGEANPVERVDNAMYRLGGHATADKIEAQGFLRKLPKAISDPKVQEELYHAIEARMVDAKAAIPEHLRLAMAAMRPWYEEQTRIINRLRERKDPSLEPYLEDEGYVARRAKGYSPQFDVRDPGERGRDPFAGRRSLSKTTTALKGRKFIVLEDENGNRMFPSGQDEKRNPYAEMKPGMEVRGSFDKPLKVKQATTAEIENANVRASRTGEPVRYHKNAVVNTVDNVIRLRRVERNLQVLDEITKNLKAEGMAHQSEWHYPNEDGQLVLGRNPQPRPDGFVELPHIPQLRGWSFDPRVAETLKDYIPGPDEPIDGIIAKVNRALTASLFITPFPHAANVGAHWAVGRGWDWIKPGAYRSMMKTGTKAVTEVLTMGPKYREMLREGSGLLYGDTATRNFHQLMLEKAGAELTQDPQTWRALASAFRTGNMTPADVVKLLYSTSQKALWAANDIFLLQRQMELEAKGMARREAIAEAEKDIPNYRVPSQVMNSRAVAQVIKSPNYLLFGRYKYGQLKAWGTMFRDMVKGTAEEKKEAFGKFLMAVIIANVVYPMADHVLKQVTGNKDAKFKRAGPFSLTDAAYDFSTGQKDFAAAMASFITPSPLLKDVAQGTSNRDLFTGKHLIEPESSTAGKVAQGLEAAAGSFYPAELALQAAKPDSAGQAAGRLFGVELPPPDRDAKRAKGKAYGRSMARAREKKDPMTQKLKDLGL